MHTHLKLSLIEHFKTLPDPRVHRTRAHQLVDVLTIGVCTLLCAGESFNDMEGFGHAKADWFKIFLALPNGIPGTTRSTASLPRWTRGTSGNASWPGRKACARPWSGRSWPWTAKRLRRALDADEDSQVIVSAWAQTNGLVLGQLKVDD